MTEPPRAMRVPCGFRRQDFIDTAPAQFLITGPTAFPLLPHDTPQLPAYPAVKVHQHRGRLAKAEIAVPSPQIEIEFANHPLQTNAPRALRNFRSPDIGLRQPRFHWSSHKGGGAQNC